MVTLAPRLRPAIQTPGLFCLVANMDCPWAEWATVKHRGPVSDLSNNSQGNSAHMTLSPL